MFRTDDSTDTELGNDDAEEWSGFSRIDAHPMADPNDTRLAAPDEYCVADDEGSRPYNIRFRERKSTGGGTSPETAGDASLSSA